MAPAVAIPVTTAKRAAAILLLLAAAAAGALLYHRHGLRAGHDNASPDLLAQVPAGSQYLLSADVAALRSSPFLERFTSLAPAPRLDREYADFVSATGFDYTHDLDRVVVAAKSGSPPNRPVILAEGRFDTQRIVRYALRSGKLERHNGVDVYIVPANTESKTMSFAFLSPTRIAIADGSTLDEVIVPHGASPLDATMQKHIGGLSGSALFAVVQVNSIPAVLPFGGGQSEQLSRLARNLRWFTLAVQPTGDRMRVSLQGECDTSENARQVAGTLETLRFVGQAALADPKTRRGMKPREIQFLQTLLRAIEVSQEGVTVQVRVELTPDMAGSLAGMAAPKKDAPRSGAHSPSH